MTKEEYEVDDLSDLTTLIEAIRLQSSTGPTEAARALRKKLYARQRRDELIHGWLIVCRKYGNPHRQLRSLVILDDLIQNAGPNFQRQFADEPLLERLRLIVTEPVTDVEVKQKCNSLYRQWAVSHKNTPGMQDVAALYKQLPQRKRNRPRQDSQASRPTQPAEDPFGTDEPPPRERSGSIPTQESGPSNYSSPSSSSFPASIHSSLAPPKKDKKSLSKEKAKPFKFERERSQITHVLTMSNIEATGLLNALTLLDKDKDRVSSVPAVRQRYDTCKALHRQTLRYCSLVTDENYLGALLQANDQVAEATRLYEQLDRSFDYDSDSEDYNTPARGAAKSRMPASPPATRATLSSSATRQEMASLSLNDEESPGPPTRPPTIPTVAVDHANDCKGKTRHKATPADEDEDDNDPFADRNEVNTPRVEKEGFSF